MKSQPNNLEALSNSAYAYYSMNDYDNAKIMANKVLNLDKANKTALDLISSIEETQATTLLQEAIGYYEKGEFNKSYQVLEKYLAKKPNNEYGMNIDEYFVDIVNIENGFEKPSLFQKAVEYVHNEQKQHSRFH